MTIHEIRHYLAFEASKREELKNIDCSDCPSMKDVENSKTKVQGVHYSMPSLEEMERIRKRYSNYNTQFENLFVPQGWQCPICKRVYSPSTPMCLYCGEKEATVSTTRTSCIDATYHVSCDKCGYTWFDKTGFPKECPVCHEYPYKSK